MPVEVFGPIALVCAALVMVRYIRSNRITAGSGWVLIILSIGAFGSGLAQSFTWAGLVFLFTGLLGLIVLVQDTIFRRHDDRRRQARDRRGYSREREA